MKKISMVVPVVVLVLFGSSVFAQNAPSYNNSSNNSSDNSSVAQAMTSPLHHVAPVRRIGKPVAFIGIDNELGWHMLIAQRMPELVGLGRRALAIPVAHHHQRRRVGLLDEVDRRTLRVDRGIVVDRCAEVRHHPLVDGVLAVVALPVGDARAGHGGLESLVCVTANMVMNPP